MQPGCLSVGGEVVGGLLRLGEFCLNCFLVSESEKIFKKSSRRNNGTKEV